jgi:valyl-tRNA synthetase
VHRAAWPDIATLRDAAGSAEPTTLDMAGEVLGAVRKAKSEARRSMRAEVERVVVRDTPERLQALGAAMADLREAGRIAELVTEVVTDEASTPSVEVELAPEEAA